VITDVPATSPALIQTAPAALPAAGAVLGTIVIPRIGLSVVFRQGTGASVLAAGPGHYPATALPGSGGTIGIAGHRVTHSHPFLELNRLRKGDRIVIITGGRRYLYRVFLMRIVPPRQIWPLHRRRTEQLVLTACHPPRTALRRLVVFAERVALRRTTASAALARSRGANLAPTSSASSGSASSPTSSYAERRRLGEVVP